PEGQYCGAVNTSRHHRQGHVSCSDARLFAKTPWLRRSHQVVTRTRRDAEHRAERRVRFNQCPFSGETEMKRLGLIALITALGLALSVPSFGMTAHRHHKRHRPVAVISRVNINTASREQLMQLPHINEATADRIIAGRPW